jgi:hypothetical protein
MPGQCKPPSHQNCQTGLIEQYKQCRQMILTSHSALLPVLQGLFSRHVFYSLLTCHYMLLSCQNSKKYCESAHDESKNFQITAPAAPGAAMERNGHISWIKSDFSILIKKTPAIIVGMADPKQPAPVVVFFSIFDVNWMPGVYFPPNIGIEHHNGSSCRHCRSVTHFFCTGKPLHRAGITQPARRYPGTAACINQALWLTTTCCRWAILFLFSLGGNTWLQLVAGSRISPHTGHLHLAGLFLQEWRLFESLLFG